MSELLKKFESKSARVKGVALHTKRPWILASLHSGVIQLWDYRTGTLIETFVEHDGPVRSVAFHLTQPMFCSGGDDYKVKIWNYKNKKSTATLTGHVDYIRTVFFHHESPWILSASDDQTIRIWNWQSRSLVTILTGHSHYVMCAQFHPELDIVASASLDQTVRVWDISGLRKKGLRPQSQMQSHSYDSMSGRGQQGDMFGSQDVVVKFVLTGHDRGVNWVAFHPTLPLICSTSDDRQIKIWRMSDGNRCVDTDSFRGHFNNISGAVFHPRAELLISAAEDKSIRLWSMQTRQALATFRRPNDRFWVVAVHPQLNLFAAGHDSGFMVFKFERERTAFAVSYPYMFYVKNKSLCSMSIDTGVETVMVSLTAPGKSYTPPLGMSYNPAEKAIIVYDSVEGGSYEIFQLDEARQNAKSVNKRSGKIAFFVARARYAVLSTDNKSITVYDFKTSNTKVVNIDITVTYMFPAFTGVVLLSNATTVYLYNLQERSIMAEITAANIKYVAWNSDNSLCALMGKHVIVIVDKELRQKCLIHETIRIKSGVWEDSGVFIYTTLNHIKYTLSNGDNGIIQTLDQCIYLSRMHGSRLSFFDREGTASSLEINPAEFLFKVALVNKQYAEVLRIIQTSNLVGQSIIAYLRSKGYPEVALQFVKDPATRYELALECGNIEVALESAKILDKLEHWANLAKEAFKLGYVTVAEFALQRSKDYQRLNFMYLCTGQTDKLTKMRKIAETRGDVMGRLLIDLWTGDYADVVTAMLEAGQYGMAYTTACTYGMTEEAENILQKLERTQEDAKFLPSAQQLIRPATAINKALEGENTYQIDWPHIQAEGGLFQSSAAAIQEPEVLIPNLQSLDIVESAEDPWGGDVDIENDDMQGMGDLNADGEGWGANEFEEELNAEFASSSPAGMQVQEAQARDEQGYYVAPTAGPSMLEKWKQNSQSAAELVACGDLEGAMLLLHRQIAVVNFAPLKHAMISMSQVAQYYLPLMPPVHSHSFPLSANPLETESYKMLPAVVANISNIRVSKEAGLQSFLAGKFEASLEAFLRCIGLGPLSVTIDQSEHEEVLATIQLAQEYITAIRLELRRREIANDQPQLSLELACYFANCRLQAQHKMLAVRSAMMNAFKSNCLTTASVMARRLLEMQGGPQMEQAARKMQGICDQRNNPQDSLPIKFDSRNHFVTCASTMQPIYTGQPSIECGYCHAPYMPSEQGTLCKVCNLSEIGLACTGLRTIRGQM